MENRCWRSGDQRGLRRGRLLEAAAGGVAPVSQIVADVQSGDMVTTRPGSVFVPTRMERDVERDSWAVARGLSAGFGFFRGMREKRTRMPRRGSGESHRSGKGCAEVETRVGCAGPAVS